MNHTIRIATFTLIVFIYLTLANLVQAYHPSYDVLFHAFGISIIMAYALWVMES